MWMKGKIINFLSHHIQPMASFFFFSNLHNLAQLFEWSHSAKAHVSEIVTNVGQTWGKHATNMKKKLPSTSIYHARPSQTRVRSLTTLQLFTTSSHRSFFNMQAAKLRWHGSRTALAISMYFPNICIMNSSPIYPSACRSKRQKKKGIKAEAESQRTKI